MTPRACRVYLMGPQSLSQATACVRGTPWCREHHMQREGETVDEWMRREGLYESALAEARGG